MPLTLSAVIPTRNRPDDLRQAVRSILWQTRPPEELIVVDQSPGDESEIVVRALFDDNIRTRVVYIHDQTIAGLVAAKHVASKRAKGDVVCFLEDDVMLEPEYIAQVEGGFLELSDMWGCSGIITNPPRSSCAYVIAHTAFFRGIFRDPRVRLTVGH